MSLSLLKYCELAKETVADVARRAGIDDKWLYKVAKGEAGFSLATADKIEKATEGAVTISDLNKVRMDWLAENPPPPKPQKKSLAAEGAA